MNASTPRRRLVFVLLAALAVSAGCGRIKNPLAPPNEDAQEVTTPADTGNTGTPAKKKVVWGGGDGLRIPVDDKNPATFGPTGCPVLVAGSEVWNLARNKVVGR